MTTFGAYAPFKRHVMSSGLRFTPGRKDKATDDLNTRKERFSLAYISAVTYAGLRSA